MDCVRLDRAPVESVHDVDWVLHPKHTGDAIPLYGSSDALAHGNFHDFRSGELHNEQPRALFETSFTCIVKQKPRAMKSVRNAIRSLELFSEDTPTISVSQVSEYLRIPKSSASRMLSAMKEGGIIEQDQKGGRYKPSVLALKLANTYSSTTSSRELVRAAMHRLAAETRHSCWISTLSHSDIVVLEGIHGGYPIRLVVEAGSRLPAHATAAGKVLLARLQDDQIRALYPSGKLPSYTRRTLPNVEQLLAEIADVRVRRWAETRQEVIDGIKSIGVSFCVPGETAILALSISFPVANISATEEAAVRASLLRIGGALGNKLGDPAWRDVKAEKVKRSLRQRALHPGGRARSEP